MEFQNTVKERLKRGEKTAGAWLQLVNPLSAEILARAGFDWLIIDMEHAPNDYMCLISQFQAIWSGNPACVPLVRAPWNDHVTIKRILDCGAYGVLIPQIYTAEDARQAVRACKYPPLGVRGIAGSPRAAHYGQNIRSYLDGANNQTLVIVAVETPEAAANIEEIVQVEGLDGIFIGPMDLATSLGHFCDPGHPEVQEVIARVETAVASSGKFLGTVASGWEKAKGLYDKGYQFLMLMADGGTLSTASTGTMAHFLDEVRGER